MNIVDLYILSINDNQEKLLNTLTNLNDEQIERINRYKFLDDKLRSIGSFYLQNNFTGDNKLLKTENGKPYKEDCFFNVSHSGEYVILGKANVDIGVDIEQIKEKEFTIFKNLFTEQEYKFIENEKLFYPLWCNKESLIKCKGETIANIKEAPALPFIGVRKYKEESYFTKNMLYGNYVISITLKIDEEFKINIIRLDL